MIAGMWNGASVAIVGAGAMGSRIAARLLQSGVEVAAWNRSRDKLRPLVEVGATATATPAEAARGAEIVITMVADPAALRTVSEGVEGIAAGSVAGQTLIEMSTVGPAAVQRLAGRLPAGVGLLDAPVLGSLSEAESGSLTIFAGGDRDLYERSKDLLELLGSPLYVGPLGSGAAAKLVANYSLFGILGVLGEALALSDRLGLDHETTFSVLAASPLSAQADKRRPALESDEHPLRFPISLAHKDAGLIMTAAEEAGLTLEIAEALEGDLAAAEAAGWGDRDYSTLVAWLRDR